MDILAAKCVTVLCLCPQHLPTVAWKNEHDKRAGYKGTGPCVPWDKSSGQDLEGRCPEKKPGITRELSGIVDPRTGGRRWVGFAAYCI